MQKKIRSMLGAAMAAAMLLSLPAAAAAELVTEDTFSSAKSASKWKVDNYEPEDFDITQGVVYLAMGSDGYRRNRPDEQKDKSYAMQGYKLKAGKVGGSWTATVKLKVDDTWYGIRDDVDISKRKDKVESSAILDNKKKVVFRVDIPGTTMDTAPAITLIKGGDGAPTFKYYDPEEYQGWGTASFQWVPEETDNKTKKPSSGSAVEAVPDDWHTLIIACKNGIITYSVDDQKIGSYKLDAESTAPSYLALSMQNFNRPDVSVWDDCRLYDGIYTYSKA